MPRDIEQIADVMLLAIKAALGPVQSELAATKQANADLRARVDDLSGLRDRMTAMETKAAIVIPPTVAPAVDPGPSLNDIELLLTKQVGPMSERLARLEERPQAAAPVLEAPVPVVGPSLSEIELTLTKQIGPLSERLARVEERAPVPGPAGAPGTKGLNGSDGADGLGFDDFGVTYDGDRTIEVKMQRGDRVKSWPIVLPFQKQQGVFSEGKSYVPGDVVTWAGSQWHCNEQTATKPGEGSKAWTLIVKRGRDGKDGRDAATLPVVKP